jgi:hypothetical protein
MTNTVQIALVNGALPTSRDRLSRRTAYGSRRFEVCNHTTWGSALAGSRRLMQGVFIDERTFLLRVVALVWLSAF